MKPQYPMNDPYAINRLLTQLLAVVVTILVVVVGGMAWLILKGRVVWGHRGRVVVGHRGRVDSQKRKILEDETNSQPMGNIVS